MTRVRKVSLGLMALLCAVCLGVGLASCGGKDAEPTYGYGEEGTYYYSASDGSEFILTLEKGIAIQSYEGGGSAASYAYDSDEGMFVFTEDGEDMATGSLTEGGLTVTYNGRSYLFLSYEYYTVSFVFGSEVLTTQSVLNGKAASDPGDASKEGYVFLGWYADSAYTTRYEFNTSVTSNTTIYARFVEIEGITEYTVTYDFGDGETYTAETLNGKIYDLPEAEQSGYTFLGWWVSATNQADELTYRYTDETLYEDTTLYAVYASGSYIGASIKDGVLTWLNAPGSQMSVTVTDEKGSAVASWDQQATQTVGYDFTSLSSGKYTVEVTSGGVTETLTYVSNGLYRTSGFSVISGSILMYSEVANAERYYITIDCGNTSHDHSLIDNGTSLYYDFSSCDMPSTGITFTVVAFAEGYYYSVSSYNYFLGLDNTEVKVEGNEITWETVPYAMSYEVYIDGILVATTSDTSYSLSNYGTGTYEIAVKPVTTGYYSEKSETISFTKTTLASPTITGIADYTISWTPVYGATGYIVSINGVETTISSGGITSLILTDDNYTEGLDEYEISVKAMAQDSSNDSPYSDAITVTGTSVGSAVSYSNGTVTWQYSLSATEYRITVNDGDELVVTGTNSSPVTLTKSGNNEITIYFVDDEDNIYGTASVTVYAYAIVFDARGGTAYLNGEAVDTIYVAKGDTVTLPDATYEGILADFLGWYTLPDLTADPDADSYMGDGVLYEDGTVFTGNSTIVLYASWINQRLQIALDPGMGTLTDESGNDVLYVDIPIYGVSYSVPVPECDDKAYAFVGWYTGANGTGSRYTYEDGSASTVFSRTGVTTLYAYWVRVLDFSLVEYQEETVLAVSQAISIYRVTSVTVPETYEIDGVEYTVKYIGNDAFSSCDSLEVINIPDTVIYFDITNGGYESGSGALAQSGNIRDVNVYETGEPSSTREIIYYSEDGVLFRKTESGDAELLYYPQGRTEGTYEIPEEVSNANEFEISGGNEVPAVRSVTALADGAFRSHTELTYMVIPGYIESTGTYTFYGCTSLTGVEFEREISEITDSMFFGCSSLAGFDVPSTVGTIGDSAFRGCTALTTFTVPENVETMGAYVFYGCTSLETVEVRAPIEAVDIYTFYGCTSLKGVEIPNTVTEIGDYAFYGCSALAAFSIPSTVRRVGDYAFRDCTALETLTLSEGLVTLGEGAFRGCSSLVSVALPSTLEAVTAYAFYECTALTDITIADRPSEIGDYAFYECSSLLAVAVPSSVKSIGAYAFHNCTAMRSLTFSAGLETIGDYAFNGCVNLKTVVFPEGLTSIGKNAFYGCKNLIKVVIPTTLSSIGSNGFRYCYKLVEICDLSSGKISSKSNSNNGYLASNAINIYYTSDESESHIFSEDEFTYIYDSDSVYLLSYDGDSADIVFPGSVRDGESYEIYKYAFYASDTLESVLIPSSVTAIGDYVFYQCALLASVTIYDGAASIGSYTFYQCDSLKEIVIPSSVVTIGTYAFLECAGLENVTLNEGLESIGNQGFRDCVSLKEISMPSTVTSLGNYAFYGCTSLEKVTLNEGLTSMGTYMFTDCVSLREITIPSTVTSIGNYDFNGCTSLETVTIVEGPTSIGNQAFSSCDSLIEIVIPSTVTSIGQYAFRYCYSLRSVTLNEGLTTINTYAFQYDYSLTSITIPSTVTSIGNYSFQYCYKLVEVCNLSSLGISAGGTSFTSNGGLGNYALNVYTASSGESRMIDLDGFVYIADGDAYRLVDYYGTDTDLVLTGVMENGNYDIYDYAFCYNGSIESVAIEAAVGSVGDGAFYGCSALESATIAEGVTYIGDYSFYECVSLKAMSIPSTAASVGAYAFYECVALETVTIPDGVGSVGEYAFYDCTGLTEITIPSTAASIGQYAFRGCTGLKTVTISEGVTSIGNYAFYGCSSIETLYIPSTVKSVGNNAFYNCTSLTKVVLEDGVETLGTYVFYGCRALEEVTLSQTLTSIGNYCFYNCSSLTFIVFPDSVTSLGSNTFQGCSSLEWVVIGKGMSSIGSGSFNGCTSIEAVYYMGTSSDWNKISITATNNTNLTGADRYYYSETEPTDAGNFWHYDENGEIAVWE